MKTNAHYTEIAFVLDRSGSMKSCQQAAIDGFNRFLADHQQIEGLAKLTLVLFDDEYFVPISSIPVQEVVPGQNANGCFLPLEFIDAADSGAFRQGCS